MHGQTQHVHGQTQLEIQENIIKDTWLVLLTEIYTAVLLLLTPHQTDTGQGC